MNVEPLDLDSRVRFKALASSIVFDGLAAQDIILGKTTLAGLLLDDNALTNAPKIIDSIPGFPASLKRIFDAAFEAARIPHITANGTELPSSTTVAVIAGVLGGVIGLGLAILIID